MPRCTGQLTDHARSLGRPHDCHDDRRLRWRRPPHGAGPRRRGRHTDFFKRFTDLYEEQHDGLAGLNAPGDASDYKRYVDQLGRNIDGYNDAIGSGTVTSDAFDTKRYNSEKAAGALADQAGLRECSAPESH
jgi:hypothetical protein